MAENIEEFYTMFFSEKTPYEQYRSRVTNEKILGAISGKSGKILDLGCGEGELLALLKGAGLSNFEFFGADIGLKNLEKMDSENLAKADLEKPLPFKSNCFDVVVLQEVIEHLVERDQIISEMHRILKKEGILVITCPHKYSLVLPGYLIKNNLLHRMQPVENWLSKRELRSLLGKRFKKFCLRSYNFVPYHSVLPKAMIPIIKKIEEIVQNTPVDRKLIAVAKK